MTGRRNWWIMGLVSNFTLFGCIITGVLLLMAHRFVKEFTHSHVTLDEEQFSWDMPLAKPEPSHGFRRPLTIRTCDGKRLSGEFWAQPHPAPTIILCHGYRVPRIHLHPVAALEYHYGYNILLFDFRGHGESARAVISGGNAEVRDLEAAVALACQQAETLPRKLFLHGFSMGASVTLLMPAHAEVVGIIADSPYARLDDILRRIAQYRFSAESTSWPPSIHWLRGSFPVLAWVAVAASRLLFRLRFGHPLIARPDLSFKRRATIARAAGPLRPPAILLIHSSDDELIPLSHAQQLAVQAQAYHVPIETYFVEHATHGGAYGRDPEQYCTRIEQFIAHQLGDEVLPV
jgi:alpha-beta hydrolase superfamily lysophospholipase